MKHFAFSRWDLTGKIFLHSVFAQFDSAEEAEKHAMDAVEKYGDQTFAFTLEAKDYIDAKEKAIFLGLMK